MKSFALSLILLSGCSIDIDYHMPANRFETPETAGRTLGGKAGLSYAGSHEITLAEVTDTVFSSTTVDESVSIENSRNANAHLGLGLVSFVDVYARLQGESADVIGLKIQPIGSPQLEREEGFKLAVLGGLGKADQNDGQLQRTGTTYSARTEIDYWEGGLILGYRFREEALAYLSAIASEYDIDARLVSSDNSVNVTAKGISKSQAINLGIEYSIKDKSGLIGTLFILEAGFAKGEWRSINSTTIGSIGFLAGLIW